MMSLSVLSQLWHNLPSGLDKGSFLFVLLGIGVGSLHDGAQILRRYFIVYSVLIHFFNALCDLQILQIFE